MQKSKIFYILDNLNIGGVQTVLMNTIKNLDHDSFEIDVVSFDSHCEEDHEEELKKMGIKLIKIPKFGLNYFKYIYTLYRTIKENGPYSIVHSHLHLNNGIVLLVSALCRVPLRISHSHSIKRTDSKESIFKKIFESLMKFLINRFSNKMISSSLDAGYYLYGENEFDLNGTILQNGIDLEQFKFSKDARYKNRIKFSLENKVVIGNIASLRVIKNQVFLLELLKRILKDEKNAVLLLIGEGIEKNNLLIKAQELGIDDKVFFLGNRLDIPELLCAMDIFILPSLSEGLGIVSIEAQANGLPVIISDGVPNEVIINNNVKKLHLNDSINKWSKATLELVGKRTGSVNSELYKAGYDISNYKYSINNIYNELKLFKN